MDIEYLSKEYMLSLDKAVKEIYPKRRVRPLDDIIIRTFGKGLDSAFDKEQTFFDKDRKKYVMTEYAEFLESLRIYDKDKSLDNKVSMLLEIGDIIFQHKIVKQKYPEDKRFNKIFNKAISYIKGQLKKRDIDFSYAERLAEVKYSLKAYLMKSGKLSKDPKLEKRLCKEYYIRYIGADDQKII